MFEKIAIKVSAHTKHFLVLLVTAPLGKQIIIQIYCGLLSSSSLTSGRTLSHSPAKCNERDNRKNTGLLQSYISNKLQPPVFAQSCQIIFIIFLVQFYPFVGHKLTLSDNNENNLVTSTKLRGQYHIIYEYSYQQPL